MSGYRGDVEPEEAYRMLQSDPQAVLVDVRSQAEWHFVGLPDLSALEREPVLVEWAKFPGMVPDPDFAKVMEQRLKALGVRQDATLLFLCRSGVRSRNAAIAMTGQGYGNCFNVSEGFEGDLDSEAHRGGKNGWKRRGLPWRQG
ncbi:MAG: rhodanese-like domain-containing protein [Flavobacteriaceae bacterium]